MDEPEDDGGGGFGGGDAPPAVVPLDEDVEDFVLSVVFEPDDDDEADVVFEVGTAETLAAADPGFEDFVPEVGTDPADFPVPDAEPVAPATPGLEVALSVPLLAGASLAAWPFTSVALRSRVAYGFFDPASPPGLVVSLLGGDFLSAMKNAVLFTQLH